jgi:aminoglycoside phosphotransferase (APT) family kinase protein
VPRDPVALADALFGRTPEVVEPLVVWPGRATYRVVIDGRNYVIKTDDEHDVVAREASGQQRAAAAGIPVPELVAVVADATAMTWIDGEPLRGGSSAAAWRDTGARLRAAHDLGVDAPFGAGFGGYATTHRTWREFFEAFAEQELRACEETLGLPAGQAARIRDAVRASAPLLAAPVVGWCHGDFQPEHVLIDPANDRVVSIIDWADHGSADITWDVMVLTLDDARHLDALLDGYGADGARRTALAQRLPLFGVVRLLGEAHWLAEHGVGFDESLRRAIDWRP